MQYVPTIAPIRTAIEPAEEPVPVEGVRAAKRIVARTAPPLIFQHGRVAQQQAEPAEQAIQRDMIERRRVAAERRQVCRRVDHAPVALDTRSEHDRRGLARRNEDHLDASVDIEV